MKTLLGLSVTLLMLGCGKPAAETVESAESSPSASQTPAETDASAAVEKALNEGDATAVLSAVSQLKETGDTADVIKLLIRGLGNDNDDVRETCSQQLVELAPDNRDVILVLMNEGVQDQDPVVRQHAVEALGQIGPPAKVAVPVLVQIEEDEAEQDDVRKAATLALQQINQVQESPADDN